MSSPLILLPGLICDARTFEAQGACFECLMIDGFGARASLEDMARHVLDTGPERMSILGHSMGGRVALEIWRQAPERVERLALLNTGVHGVRPGEPDKRFALRDLGRTEGMEALVDQWLPPMIAPANQEDPALMSRLRRMCVEAGLAAFEAQITALLARSETASLLPSIDRPVLIATGSEDVWAPPEQHREIAAAIPGSVLEIIDRAGHMLPAEAPEFLNAAIGAWLERPARN
jgi:pimeloyl-ACP methyl ester carboxylesterase